MTDFSEPSIPDEGTAALSIDHGVVDGFVSVRAKGQSWKINYRNPWDPKVNEKTGEITWVFIPPRLGEDIRRALSIVRGPGGSLWYDAGGVYRPEAEEIVEAATRQILIERFRKNRLAEVLAWCRTLPTEISTDPPPENLLNVANGVLNLDTLEVRAVADDECFTYQIPIRWNPGAKCPEIEKFVNEVVPDDCGGLVAEIIGMCLLPTYRYRRCIMLLGAGNNGKSVLLRLIRTMIGEENVSSKTLHALTEDRFSTAVLFGKLANIAGDLDSRPIERSDTFKMLTGGDPISAEHKYGQPFEFTSYATMVFSANEWPVSHDQSNAYFRRWVAIPFTQTYIEGPKKDLKEGERPADPKLGDRITTQEELEGLLVKGVQGAIRLRKRGGFEVPKTVRDTITDYRAWADTVMAWIDDAVTSRPDVDRTRRDVYLAYQEWCKNNGRKGGLSTKKFWPRVREVLEEQGTEFEESRWADGWHIKGLHVSDG